jgi:parallel beta-helix repeat protein
MRRLVLAALAVIFIQGAAYAAEPCSDRTPAAITSVAEVARKCQETIAREGGKFLRAKMIQLSKCNLNEPIGTCPTSKVTEKIEKAAMKAAEKIGLACGDDAAQGGLNSSYALGTDPAVISSCMLSQHNVAGGLEVANAHGPTTELWFGAPIKEGGQCIREISKRARLFADKALLNATICIKGQMKNGTAGNLSPICVGSVAGGVFVPPTDLKTAEKQAKLIALTETKVAEKCDFLATTGLLPTLMACGGVNSIAELQQCLMCQGWNTVFDAVQQQYSETGKFVAHGPGALQAAVTAASDGDKLLIASGTYEEEVVANKNNFSLVGCGGATDDRPRVIPPAPEVSGTGIDSNAVTNILYQSLRVDGQDNNGIRTTNSTGVTYRDIVGDGNLQSAYAIFPRTCNNVVIELCKTTRSNDSPLYVGQSSTILVRWNDARESVAAIEIENSGNARVYGNYATGNTGGMLVFKDGSLPVQLAQCHEVHHNVLENNNTPNFGSGTVAGVPRGTGLLIVSADSTLYHHNILRGNESFGLALTDAAFGGLPIPAEQNPENNYIYDNWVTGNAGFPDETILPPGVSGDFLAIAISSLPADGNCDFGNVGAYTEIGLSGPGGLPDCTFPPPAFPLCPAPSVP